MKSFKRLISLVVALIMTFSMLAGCSSKNKESGNVTTNTTSATAKSNDPEYLNITGYPIVKQPITLKAMVMKTPVHANYDYGKLAIWEEYEKKSGIKIEFEQVLQSALTEKRNLAFASGDLPDIFYRCNIPVADSSTYGEQGMLINLNTLVDRYAPNMKKAINEYPEVKKGITELDGSFYSLPSYGLQ